ncbi:PH protein [Venustampulla echinocandica]|uniref:PH protein n=1 Tax=Venustampulla echinocandica TaxID=2656787 RepID=A0A370TDF5_9HELO|nr:PH protein [Venustampulla echinocandica]RDL32461.1 PH protein [Venustampulla echinocandica]
MSTLNAHSAVPSPSQAHLDRGYGGGTPQPPPSHLSAVTDVDAADFEPTAAPEHRADTPSHLAPPAGAAAHQNHGRFNEEWDSSQRGSSIIDGPSARPMPRSNSPLSQGDTLIPSRGGTLKKKASLRRTGSLKRSSSRRSSRAGSVRSLALQPGEDEAHSAFHSPVPTSGNPTEILANRFQAWRKVLKDLITYFREVQASYDHKSKNLIKISNLVNNTSSPPVFLRSGGIDDALQVLRSYHRSAIMEANKAKEIENDVLLALVGLRSDLNQKIKEIKSLSGDFKNSVDKEMEGTRKAVNNLQDGLGRADVDPAQMTGKHDPYLLKLAVDRQIERQIDEENYLHQAYLNLEASGRELESIVVGEIQKSYNAYAGILKREAEGAYNTVEELRTGPISMPKDHEWNEFVENDEHFVDPRVPVRLPQNIQYPGRDNYLAQAIREGLLERKSKYLKSYTPGWYVLTPTHLHEFKSADKTQTPIMSLYLPEQKLGSNSQEGASSNKFMMKGRQTGAMHRGHSWVFRAESYETMLGWLEDIRTLTEKTPQERHAFVRQHARSVSGTSQRASSISSDGVLDEDDEEPFSATTSAVMATEPKQDVLPRRPEPGGRFPSDLQVNTQRGLQAPLSPSSGSSSLGDAQDRDIVAAATNLPGSSVGQHYGEGPPSPSNAAKVKQDAMEDGINPYTYEPIQNGATNRTEAGTAPAGPIVGGAVVQSYQNHEPQPNQGEEVEAAEYQRQQERQAALEAINIAAPDTHEQQAAHKASDIAAPDTYSQQAAQQAALEATIIAAPDARPDSPGSNVTSGGRSLGSPAEVGALNNVRAGIDPVSKLDRPAEHHQQSERSISHFHVPGEYPRNNPESKGSVVAEMPV